MSQLEGQVLPKFADLNNQDIIEQQIATVFFMKTFNFSKYSNYLSMNTKYKFQSKVRRNHEFSQIRCGKKYLLFIIVIIIICRIFYIGKTKKI